MDIEQVRRRFETLSLKGIECRLNVGATLSDVHHIEQRLKIQFPEPLVQFWTSINGVEVAEPRLVIYPLASFVMNSGLLIFAECNGGVRLAFDTSERNEADQWSILNADTGYRVTYTLGSFCCIHGWTWLLKRRPIWFHAYVDAL